MGFKHDLKKFKPRKTQTDTLEFVDKTYKDNPLTKFFLLDLPVGVGKSHLSLMLTDWYRKNVNRMARVDVITNTKILQDQYIQTYESINDLKGKANYYCSTYECSCEQALEFHRLNKTSPDECCEYIPAREGYMNGGISLTNFYLHILYAMYNEKLMDLRGAEVLIVDEAHNLDDVMSDFISVSISENLIKKFKLPDEKQLLYDFKGIKTTSEFVSFLTDLLESVSKTLELMEGSVSAKEVNRNIKINKVLNNTKADHKTIKLMTDLSQMQMKLESFLTEYKINKDNWVMESSWDPKSKKKSLSLEPIWAYDYLDKYLFSKYKMVFFMSGSILDKQIFCYLNGLDTDKAEYYSIPSPFNPKNRPIYYMPVGKMSYAQKTETFENYKPWIDKILTKYKNKKGIIHTNSFELSNWFHEGIINERFLFHDSTDKDEILEKHKQSDKDTVIVSPSMDTGVSFDDNYARFQIIAKVPYPSLASLKNKRRQLNYPDWYAWKTVTNLVQMFGRPVRSYTDYADTIIIDASFGDVMRYSSKFIPEYFQSVIKTLKITNKV